jgi:hypothetical protein
MLNQTIIYRRAKPKDYSALLDIASAYYRDSPNFDASQGFLNNHFSEAILNEINQQMGILMAEKAQCPVGFLGIMPYSDKLPSPVVRALFEVLPSLKYNNKPLSGQKPFFFGPICISQAASGLGIFKGLYRAMWTFLPFEKYQCGVAFISKQNLRSLEAHVKGLGAEVIGEFTLQDQAFWIIAYPRSAAKNIALE